MAVPLVLSNGDLLDPDMIHSVVKFPGKGVAVRNGYNKIANFIREADERRQAIIVKVLLAVLSNRDWTQPVWEDEFRA